MLEKIIKNNKGYMNIKKIINDLNLDDVLYEYLKKHKKIFRNHYIIEKESIFCDKALTWDIADQFGGSFQESFKQKALEVFENVSEKGYHTEPNMNEEEFMVAWVRQIYQNKKSIIQNTHEIKEIKETVSKPISQIIYGGTRLKIDFKGLRFDINNCSIKHRNLINKYERDFIKHSNQAVNFKDEYVENNNGIWKGWVVDKENGWLVSELFKAFKRMTWHFFIAFHDENIPCNRCRIIIESFDNYTPHHIFPYSFEHLGFIIFEGLWKVVPMHKECHQPGPMDSWINVG